MLLCFSFHFEGSGNQVGSNDGNSTNSPFAVVSGGLFNEVVAELSVVGGGQSNTVAARASTIGGGEYNVVEGVGSSTISGGRQNAIMGNTNEGRSRFVVVSHFLLV